MHETQKNKETAGIETDKTKTYKEMRIFHTFGDSHAVCKGWDAIDFMYVKKNFIGSHTMANFGLQKLTLFNIKNYGVNENDIVCFCFGEIDCRAHISKPKNYEWYKNLIDNIIPDYFEAIKLNVEQYSNLTIMVFNVVPAIRITQEFLDSCPINIKSSFWGSDKERKNIVLYMNLKLKEYCEKYNYIFLDVYDKYCDNNGLLNSELKDITVHITNGVYIVDFLKEKLYGPP